MTVLIDPPRWNAHGRRWSHLVSDTSVAELHAFAAALGIPARGFEGDHYDVPEDRYADVVAAGAQEVGSRELLRRLQASGLRRRKRVGEKVVYSATTDDGLRLDAVRSALAPAAPVRRRHLAMWDGDLLLAVSAGTTLLLPEADGAALGSIMDGDGAAAQVGYARWVDAVQVTVAAEVLLHAEVRSDRAGAIGAAHGWFPAARVLDGLAPWTAALLAGVGDRPAR